MDKTSDWLRRTFSFACNKVLSFFGSLCIPRIESIKSLFDRVKAVAALITFLGTALGIVVTMIWSKQGVKAQNWNNQLGLKQACVRTIP